MHGEGYAGMPKLKVYPAQCIAEAAKLVQLLVASMGAVYVPVAPIKWHQLGGRPGRLLALYVG